MRCGWKILEGSSYTPLYKCICPNGSYFTIITKVPAMIKPTPIAVFKVNVSPKKVTIIKITIARMPVAKFDLR